MQALNLCFWALPAQRVIVIAGLALTLVSCLLIAPFNQSGRTLGLALYGQLLTFLPALALGGPMWRALAAQRAVTLAPHGRAKLLAGAIAIVVLAGLASAMVYLLLFLWVAPPRYRMNLGGYWPIFTSTVTFGSLWCIGSFLAARSALATFTVVAVLVGLSYGAVFLDLPPPASLPARWFAPVMLVEWGLFAWWYLSTRRIARSAWLSRGGAEALLVTRADSSGIAAGASREAVLQRLLLGGNSVARIGGQWLAALALLLGIELVITRFIFNSDPRLIAGAHYASLLILLVGMAMVSDGAASRLRGLWLSAALSRVQLFRLAERTLGKVAAALMASGAAFFAAVWLMQPWRPQQGMAYGLCMLLGGLLLPAYGALWGRAAWKWLVAAMLVIAVRATYWPAFVGGDPAGGWWWFAALLVATVALRMLARRRWLAADLPRAATSQAS